MLGQPLFIAGNPPPPAAPVVDASPVLSMGVDSVSCLDEYEPIVAWSTTNPDNVNYLCRVVEASNPSNVLANDIGMSGVVQFGAGVYGGGSDPYDFQVSVEVALRATGITDNSEDSNIISRSNIGPPC